LAWRNAALRGLGKRSTQNEVTDPKTVTSTSPEARTRIVDFRTAATPEIAASAVPPPLIIPAGSLLAHTYRVERLLGSGGMGDVYLARHTQLDTWHAIKVIRPMLFSNRQVHDLFRREAMVLRGVRHDAVVCYDGFFRDEQGREYLVMEYVEGPSLSDRLHQGPLTLNETYELRNRLALGLAEAHGKGAVHRDISPDNVILPEGRIERAKLIDFGLSKLTDPAQQTIVGSSFAGKFRFSSPEQLGLYGGQADSRSDMYSLGLVLAAAASGSPLDMGTSFREVIQARRGVPDLRGVPAALHDQLTAMLQPDPADRPQTLVELLTRWPATDRLAEAHSSAPGAASETASGGGKGREPSQASRRRLVAGAGALLALAAATGYRMLTPPGPGTQEMGESAHREASSASAPSLDEIAAMPRDEAAPHLRAWIARGRADDAFLVLRRMVAEGRALPAEETYGVALALKEGDRLDEAFALLQAIASQGHGEAALALGEFYDPLFWTPTSSPFSGPNPRKAEVWYRRALEQGAASAQWRLEGLAGWVREHADGDVR